MPADALPSALMVVLALAFTTAACPGQSPYDLRFADGREVSGIKGVRACLDAFKQEFRMKPGGYEAVCVPANSQSDRILRVRPIERTPLGKESGTTEQGGTSGEIATQAVGWDALPPWARGSFYTMRAVSP